MIPYFILFLAIIFSNTDSLSMDSLDLKRLQDIMKNRKIDSTNIKIDLNKGIDLNFIPQNPSKDRLSEKTLTEDKIQEIKNKARDYQVSDLMDNEIAVIETSKGTIKVKLFNDVAPKNSLNFKKLCNSGFYDYTSFHHVVKNFMIQGGDILSRDKSRTNDGTGSPGWTIPAEFNDISHKRGIISMVRSQDPDSAGSQFFICVKDSPFLDGKYTAFGEVVSGMDVVDKISTTPTDRGLILQASLSQIPEGENKEDWIEILDYEFKKKLFFKIPMGENKTSYYNYVKQEMRSKNPYRRVEIKKARVYVEE